MILYLFNLIIFYLMYIEFPYHQIKYLNKNEINKSYYILYFLFNNKFKI
jgi:hypothetical protein